MGKIIFTPIMRVFTTDQGHKILPSYPSYLNTLDDKKYSDIILCYPNQMFKDNSIYRNKDNLKSLVKSEKIKLWSLNNKMDEFYEYAKGLYVKNLPGYYYPTHSERRQKIKEIILDPLIKIIDSISDDKDILVIVFSTSFFKNRNKEFGIYSYFFYFLYVLFGDRDFWYLINYNYKLKLCDQNFYKKLTFKGHSRKDDEVYWFNEYEEDINEDGNGYKGFSGFTQEDLDQMYRDAYDNDPSNQWNTD